MSDSEIEESRKNVPFANTEPSLLKYDFFVKKAWFQKKLRSSIKNAYDAKVVNHTHRADGSRFMVVR